MLNGEFNNVQLQGNPRRDNLIQRMEFIYFGLGLICLVDQLKIGLNYKKL